MKLQYSSIKGAICLSRAITWSAGKNQNRIPNKNNITASAAVRSLAYSLLLTIYSLFTFSLSAQEPRKDSGADGQKALKPLVVGQRVPNEFWTKKHLFFIDGDTVRKSLQGYKGKMIVLDFWSSGCAPCLLHQREIKVFKDQYSSDLALIMVNSSGTKDSFEKLKSLYDKKYFEKFNIQHLETIIEDRYLTDMFSARAFPTYVWINPIERLQLQTYRNLLDRNYVAPFIDRP